MVKAATPKSPRRSAPASKASRPPLALDPLELAKHDPDEARRLKMKDFIRKNVAETKKAGGVEKGTLHIKVTPVRLKPSLRLGLQVLQGILKQPVNRLVNEAVEGYIERRTAEVESDLESTLARIKAYRLADPKFESAIAAFAAAEAGHREDPAQGTVFVASSAEPGPAQSMVQDLLRG